MDFINKPASPENAASNFPFILAISEEFGLMVGFDGGGISTLFFIFAALHTATRSLVMAVPHCSLIRLDSKLEPGVKTLPT